MLSHILTFSLLSLSQVGVTPQFQAQCKRSLGGSDVQVLSEGHKYKIVQHMNIDELTQYAFDKDGLLRRENSFILGLTENSFNYTIDVSFKYLQKPNSNTYCMKVNTNINFTGTNQLVNVATDFPHGSCSYRAVLEHELKHVNNNTNGLKRLMNNVKHQLNSKLSGEIFYGNLDTMRSKIETSIKNSWRTEIDRKLKEIHESNRFIDTKQEYERVANLCNSNVGKITQKYRKK